MKANSLIIMLFILLMNSLHSPGQNDILSYGAVQEEIQTDMQHARKLLDEGKIDQALAASLEVYNKAHSVNLQNELASACLLVSTVYRNKQNYYESFEFGLKGMHAAEKISPEKKLTAALSLVHLFSEWHVWDKVIEYAEIAKKSTSEEDHDLQVLLRKEELNAYLAQQNLDKAIWAIEDLIYVYKVPGNSEYLEQLIQLKKQKSDFGGALKIATQQLSELESKGSYSEIAVCENNIGSLYLDIDEFDFATEHCEKALKYRHDESLTTADILLNLASCLYKKNAFSRAIKTLEMAESIYKKNASQKEYSLTLALKARVLSMQGDLNGALLNANKSLSCAQQTEDLILQSEIYLLMASLTKKSGDHLISSEFTKKASVLKNQYEKNRKESLSLASEKIISINNKEKLVQNAIAAEEEQKHLIQRQLEDVRKTNEMIQLQYESELQQAALLNEQSARENAIKELDLVKAALNSEQQMRTISELEIEKKAESIKVKELNYAQLEKEKGIQLLRNQNELLASERRLKEVEIQTEAGKKAARNMTIALLIVVLLITLTGLALTRKKNNIIRSNNRHVKEVNKILQGQNEEIISSIHYARNFQDTIVPAEETFKAHIRDSFLIYEPLDIVSGDIPFIVKKNNELFIGAIDCIGHGVPAAMLSFMAYYNLNELIQERDDWTSGELLSHLHRKLTESLKKRYANPNFAAGIDIGFCRIDLKTLQMQFSGANLPILILSQNSSERIKGEMCSVGDIFNDQEITFMTHERQLKQDDRIFLLSDGFIHQFGGLEGRKKFSMKRLLDMLQSMHALPMTSVRKQLLEAFQEWKGTTSQTDDIVVIGLELNPNLA